MTTPEPIVSALPMVIDAANDATRAHLHLAVSNSDSKAPEDLRPELLVEKGKFSEAVARAEELLATSGSYYQRAGMIATVELDPETNEKIVVPLGTSTIVTALSKIGHWMKWDKRERAWVSTDPTERMCAAIANQGRYKTMPGLKGLVRQPFLRPDGSVCATDGYDPATKLYGDFMPTAYNIPGRPSRADAEAALAKLKDLITEFEFKSEHDASAAISGMLTAVVRASLDKAPMFHVRAHQIASGKSFLCSVISSFATAGGVAPVAFPAGDEECRKLLHSELMRSPAVIEFDNLTTDLKPHKSLCSALTESRISGRVLGQSKTVLVNTNALFLSSGNNVGPIADMTRRCITINLDPKSERPASRVFRRPNLMADLRRDREQYVSAALTIILAWIAAGSPKTSCKPLASFGSWADWCRQPLLWLGMHDPVHSAYEAMEEDPERETLGRLIKAWERLVGSKPVMVRDLIKATQSYTATGAEDLREVLHEVTGSDSMLNARKIGWYLKRRAGQLVDGQRIEKVPGAAGNSETWRIAALPAATTY